MSWLQNSNNCSYPALVKKIPPKDHDPDLRRNRRTSGIVTNQNMWR